jgi:sigma-B regulation protein RsbU (phosphoserine phosphatase)
MKRFPWPVLALLFFASVLDYITGPVITAAAFYIFPVALAGWQRGWPMGIGTVLAATLLNIATEWMAAEQIPRSILSSSESLLCIVFLVVCALSVQLAKKQRSLEQEHDEVVALNHRFEAELQSARALQKLMLGSIPKHPDLDISVYSEAARILGGDFIDLSLMDHDRLAIAVGDVSGKGSPAALAATIMKVLLDDAPDRFDSPSRALDYLNERLEGYLPPDMFVTLFYGILDLQTGKLTFASAGHERPFVLRSDANDLELHGEGLPLGMLRDAKYSEKSHTLAPGDLLFFYTDGLPDLMLPTGDRLGRETVFRRLQEISRRPCPDILRVLLAPWSVEGLETTDDMTMLAIRYRPRPQEKATLEGAFLQSASRTE